MVAKLEKNELVSYWKETSDKDYNTMMNLLNSGDYHWSLFLGHLVIEKLLKALYVKHIDLQVPRIHDLLRLSELAGVITSEQHKDILDKITTFNISVRYPDYQQRFYNKCTSEFTRENINLIKEMRLWLISMIEKK